LGESQPVQGDSDSDDGWSIQPQVSQLSTPSPKEGNTHMLFNAPSGSESISKIIADSLVDTVSKLTERIPRSPIDRIRDTLSKVDALVAPPTEFEAAVLIAAARVEDQPKDREFRSAQRRNYATGEQPRSSNSDR
jgi:hypothetical protein